jgi:hypothetical protein
MLKVPFKAYKQMSKDSVWFCSLPEQEEQTKFNAGVSFVTSIGFEKNQIFPSV